MIYDISGTSSIPFDVDGAGTVSAYNVSGDRVFNEKHTPTIEPIGVSGVMNPEPSPWVQGGAMYGNRLVVAQASGQQLAVLGIYDMVTGEMLGQTQLSGSSVNYHGNTVAFAKSLHSGNDSFPYLFISEYYGSGTIGVFDLSESNGTFYATEVQTIVFSGVDRDIVGYGYHDFMLDPVLNHLLLVRYKTAGTFQATEGNTTIISVFDMPEITGTDVVLTSDDVIMSHEIPVLIYARQETVYHLGFAYILAGGPNTGKLYLVDCETWSLFEMVDISNVVTVEPETLFFNGESMYVINNSGSIFKFKY